MNHSPALQQTRSFTAASAVVILFICCCVYGPFAAPAAGQAVQQPASGGVVTGSGEVTLTRQPDVLRMTMQISGEGKDIKEALAKLKSEREAIAAKLKELGAAEASVKFDPPRVGGGSSNLARQRAMQQMMRIRGGRPGAAKPEAQPKVEVSTKVTAEWSFEAGDSPEELIVNAYTLREKVKAGGLSKKSAKAELSPEELEELEEAEGMVMDEYGMEQAVLPGEPVFMFVSKVTDAERDAATAEAFKKAKADAARLAAASGSKIGEIRQVTAHTMPVAGDSDYGNDYYDGGYYQAQMMRQLGMNVPGSNADEAAGLEPGPVSLQVSVTAAFAIEEPGKPRAR